MSGRVPARTCLGRLGGSALALSPLLFVLPEVAHAERARDEVCAEVQTALDALGGELLSPALLYRIAPRFTERALPALLTKARSPNTEIAGPRLVAIGLSRASVALRALRELPIPHRPELMLAHALGRLALGDGTLTATIGELSTKGDVKLRRFAAEALVQMNAVRPKRLLYDLMEDTDPRVALIAARAMAREGSVNAVRRLGALLDPSSPLAFRRRAARALLALDRRPRADHLKNFPEPEHARALARSGGGQAVLSQVRTRLRSSDRDVRAGALAVAALFELDPPDKLARRLGKIAPEAAEDVRAELLMAQLLLGDLGAGDALAALDPSKIGRSITVLWVFAVARGERARLEVEVDARLVALLEGWLGRAGISEPDTVRLFRALEALDPEGALRLAKLRMNGPPGPGLVAALRLAERQGTGRDLPDVVSAAQRSGDVATRAEALFAARRLCRK